MPNEEFIYRLVIRYDGSVGIDKAKTDLAGVKSAASFRDAEESVARYKNQVGTMVKDYGMMKSAQIELTKLEASRLLSMKGMTEQSRETVRALTQMKLDQITKADFSKSVSGLDSTHRALERLYRTGLAFVGMWVLVQSFRLPAALLSTAIQFNSTLEDSKLGIASIFVASGEFVDSTGKAAQGWDKMNAALELSADLIEQIKVKNLETYATLEQIVKAYQSVLSFGLRLNIDPKEMLNYTVAMVQAAGALRVNLDMMAEELRSMLLGTITQKNTLIATALGITPGDIARYKNDTVGLMVFITGRLQAFSYAGILGQKTWTGLVSNVKDAIANALGTGMMPLFNYLKEQLAGLQGYIVRINKQTGFMELNPELLSSIEKWGNMFIVIIEDIKRIGRFLNDFVVPPLSLINNLLLTIVNSANAWANIKPPSYAMRTPKTYEEFAKIAEEVSEFYSTSGVIISEEDIKKGWDSYQKYGSNAITVLSRLVEDFNKSSYSKEKQLTGDLYDRSEGLKFVPALIAEISPDQAEVLMKIAAETGRASKELEKYMAGWGSMKKIGADALDLGGKHLAVTMKTAKEFSDASAAAKGMWPPGVLEEAFKDLLNVRNAMVDIEEEQAPLKIIQQIAQATDQYEKQKEIIFKLNEGEMLKLLLSQEMTPELRKQLEAMIAMERFSIEEVNRKKELKSISLTKDIIAQSQEYAKMTGNIEDQIKGMKDLEDEMVKELLIQQKLTKDEDDRVKIGQKILGLKKIGAEQRVQESVKLPIDQYMQPLAQAQQQFAQATGTFEDYSKAVGLSLIYNIIKLREQTKDAKEYKDVVEKTIALMWELHHVNMEIAKVEFKLYGSNLLQQAVSQYSALVGNVEEQNKAEQILLDNKIAVLNVDAKLNTEENKGLKERLIDYLKLIKVTEDQLRISQQMQEALNLKSEFATLLGNWDKVKQLEIETLEVQKEQALIKYKGSNIPGITETINSLYKLKESYAEAQRTMNIPVLMQLGASKALIDANTQLADMYANILPSSIDIFTNAIRNTDGTFKSFFKSMSEGFLKLAQDIALTILKMEILKALGAGKSGEGGINWLGMIAKAAIGAVRGAVGGASTTGTSTSGLFISGKGTSYAQGGITGALLAHYPIRSYQGGGIARSPQVGIFGEGGGSGEAFIPLRSGKVPVEMQGKGQGGNTYVIMNIEATDVDSFERKYRGSVNKIVHKSERQTGAMSKLMR